MKDTTSNASRADAILCDHRHLRSIGSAERGARSDFRHDSVGSCVYTLQDGFLYPVLKLCTIGDLMHNHCYLSMVT